MEENNIEYERFIVMPKLDFYPGIRVNKETNLSYENEHIKQEIKDLILHSIETIGNEKYESTKDTKIFLNEGDIIVFDDTGRGYIKPIEQLGTIKETIDELENIKEL